MNKKRDCKYCGKLLVRKKFKRSDASGYKYYTNKVFCDNRCNLLYYWLNRRKWSKEKLKEEFNKIKSECKWSSKFMNENHGIIMESIRYHWKGKNFWRSFLSEYNRKPMLDFINPKYKKIAKKLLKYWNQEEIHNGIGKVFEYSLNDGIPEIGTIDTGNISRAIRYLKKIKAVRLVRCGKWMGHRDLAQSSKYILLKTRI